MPVSPPVVCRSLGCGTATTNRNGYCDDCAGTGLVTRKKKCTNPFYGTARWKKFRAWYAKRNPLCEDCLKLGKIVTMDVVDHIIEIKDGGVPLSEDNAKSLCNHCHAKKTAAVKQAREGRVESPPTPPTLPFGSQIDTTAKLGGGGIEMGGSYGKG